MQKYTVPETICSLMLILNYLILFLPTVSSPENCACFMSAAKCTLIRNTHTETVGLLLLSLVWDHTSGVIWIQTV